jgi:CDP-diacylglycerol--glycerol-3-phosphate 3-phosphatidyltransferase
MAPVLWVLAVLSTITVIHRIRFTYVESTAREAAEKTRQIATV